MFTTDGEDFRSEVLKDKNDVSVVLDLELALFYSN